MTERKVHSYSVSSQIKCWELITIRPYAGNRNKVSRHAIQRTNGSAHAKPFKHHENEFNEYKEQTLVAAHVFEERSFYFTGDVNKDGESDFYVGGAAGQPGALYLQKNGKFKKKGIAPSSR